MRVKLTAVGLVALLGGCATVPAGRSPVAPAVEPVQINLIAFNDFHGNFQPPRQAIAAPGASGDVQVPEARSGTASPPARQRPHHRF